MFLQLVYLNKNIANFTTMTQLFISKSANFRFIIIGDGTMKWVDTNQMYIGQWEDGVQHGLGQHVWFVRRVPGSQYALRNTYNGEFVKGIRHGYGTFYYANGAKYEGYWYNNMKHGKVYRNLLHL